MTDHARHTMLAGRDRMRPDALARRVKDRVGDGRRHTGRAEAPHTGLATRAGKQNGLFLLKDTQGRHLRFTAFNSSQM